ncbi:MAG: hypothetical protein GXO43_06885 [Crenarchaeota archaeon]|nr:hypothetical protein [Thermoproteota archaeon]
MRITFVAEISFMDFYDIFREIRNILVNNGYKHEHSLVYHDGYSVDLWRGSKYSVIIRYSMKGNGDIVMLSIETYNEILYNAFKELVTRMLREKHYDFKVIEH